MRVLFNSVFLLVSYLVFVPPSAFAQQLQERDLSGEILPEDYLRQEEQRQLPKTEKGATSVGSQLFWYIPNRILDLFDVVRFRARVGPGFGAGVRVTKVAQLHLGSHGAIYAGLPGPRGRCAPKSPIGLECHTGVAVSVLELSGGCGFDPDYSSAEIGADLHLAIAGAAVGVDPTELVDFLAGFFLIDLKEDDIGGKESTAREDRE